MRISYVNVTPYDRESPVACYKLNIVAAILVIVFLLSVVQSCMLLFSFYVNKRKWNPVDMLIAYLIFINFFGIVIEFPIGIVTNIKCKWIFDELGCDLSSMVMVFVGASSIYTMSLISYDRLVNCMRFKISMINF